MNWSWLPPNPLNEVSFKVELSTDASGPSSIRPVLLPEMLTPFCRPTETRVAPVTSPARIAVSSPEKLTPDRVSDSSLAAAPKIRPLSRNTP